MVTKKGRLAYVKIPVLSIKLEDVESQQRGLGYETNLLSHHLQPSGFDD